jgi:hypothetical protein
MFDPEKTKTTNNKELKLQVTKLAFRIQTNRFCQLEFVMLSLWKLIPLYFPSVYGLFVY